MSQIVSDGNSSQEVVLAHEPTPAEIEKEAALALVVQDASLATVWIENQQWNERWEEVDILYDSPRTFKNWEQTAVAQPNVSRFTLAAHINSIHPQMIEGIFSTDDVPFMAEPRPGTSNESVRARTIVMSAQLAQMEFEAEVDLGVFQQVLHGTGIWKWGMRQEEVIDYEYSPKDQPLRSVGPLGQEITVTTEASQEYEENPKTKIVHRPFFENREIRSVLVDSGLRVPNIQKSKFVIDKSYVTLSDLLEMKKDESYDLPDEAEMRSWFEGSQEQPATAPGNLDSTSTGSMAIAGQGQTGNTKTTEDPSEQGLLLLERWDNYKVITVLNNKLVIQNRPNPYKKIPFYSANWYNRIRSFWGLGVGRMVGQEQRLNQGLTNAGLSLIQLLLDPPFVISEDSNAPTQNMRFRKGGFIKLKPPSNGNMRDAIAPLEMPKLPLSELFAFLQQSSSEAESADGAQSMLVQGSANTGGKTSLTRTLGGANMFQGASASRMQGPLDHFLNQVLIPWIYQLDELNRRFLPMAEVKQIVGEELGDAYKLDEQQFKNGKISFSALAGSRLAARKTLAQAMPLLTQIFEQPALLQQLQDISEEYVDVKEILLMWLDATGWKNRADLIKKMTPEMKARAAAKNPGAQKVQADAAKEDQKFQHAQALLQQKGQQGIARDAISASLDKAGGEILRQADEKAANPLADTGEATGTLGEQ